jgi:hypothetical protein
MRWSRLRRSFTAGVESAASVRVLKRYDLAFNFVVVPKRCFAPEEMWTRHPQTGTVERQTAASMFTQVNVHGVSRLDHFLKMFVVARDDWILRQIAFGVDR